MADLYKALAQIHAIRGQMARGTEFRGYGPETVAATGLLAGAAAMVQSAVLKDPMGHATRFLFIWISTAALAVLVTGLQTITRTRRVHSGLASQMIGSAAESFLPAIAAGVLVTLVLVRGAPRDLWLLPGLWQIFYGLGIFASCRFVPRQMLAVGVWFMATGALCLATGVGAHALSPWEMGFPFGIGQLLIAAVLKFSYRRADEDA
ncbi:MAG TPA: hypothetical protein VGM97_10705 [Steroidobacteraceae bacterium]|jgi:hypothetical protein